MATQLEIIKPNPLIRLLYAIETFLLKKASRVSSITASMCRRAVGKGVDKSKVLLFPNWSDTRFIVPNDRMNIFRQQQQLTEDDFVVMYAGGMGSKQGLELILQAAKQLEGENHIKFLIIGNGGNKQNLEQITVDMALNNVKFLDLQPYEQLPAVLTAADVHLIVQKNQTSDLVMPSKLTNILSAGRPTIATSETATALSDVLQGHDAGFITPHDNADAFSQAILSLYNDSKKVSIV